MTEIIFSESYFAEDVYVKRRRNVILIAISSFFIGSLIAGLSVFLYFHFNKETPKDDPTNIVKDDVKISPEPTKIRPDPKSVITKPPGPDGQVIKPEPEITPMDDSGKTKDEIMSMFRDYLNKKHIPIVKETLTECLARKCNYHPEKYMYEWKLKTASHIIQGTPNPDIEYEYQTILDYDLYAKKYKGYYPPYEDYANRYRRFRDNKKHVEEHNADPNRLFDMELNFFAASTARITNLSSLKIPMGNIVVPYAPIKITIPNQEIHVDWRTKGYVSNVMNQGDCASCWAFAAVDVFNSFKAIKTGKLTKYSVQQLVDCVSKIYSCSAGGNQVDGLKYIKDNDMCTDEEYEYVESKRKCTAYRCDNKTGINKILKLNKNTALDFLKNKGPFLTIVQPSSEFMLYKEGIFNGECSGIFNHSVVVVGHGRDKEKNKDYWIVKNSWSTEWGEEGYIRIVDEANHEGEYFRDFCRFSVHAYGIE